MLRPLLNKVRFSLVLMRTANIHHIRQSTHAHHRYNTLQTITPDALHVGIHCILDMKPHCMGHWPTGQDWRPVQTCSPEDPPSASDI